MTWATRGEGFAARVSKGSRLRGRRMRTHGVTTCHGCASWGRGRRRVATFPSLESALLAILFLAVLLAGSRPAWAIPIESADGKLTGSLDTTKARSHVVRVWSGGSRAHALSADGTLYYWGPRGAGGSPHRVPVELGKLPAGSSVKTSAGP